MIGTVKGLIAMLVVMAGGCWPTLLGPGESKPCKVAAGVVVKKAAGQSSSVALERETLTGREVSAALGIKIETNSGTRGGATAIRRDCANQAVREENAVQQAHNEQLTFTGTAVALGLCRGPIANQWKKQARSES